MKILKHLGLITLLLSTSSAHADNSELLVNAAMERLKHQVRYDGAYVKLDYPMGDVPANTGVCTDVVIRSYRQLGIDFQQLVHEDIKANFNQYPSKRNWGLTRPDKNIDHRRVPNLQAFFKRHGKSLAVTKNGDDYKAGDLVTWMVNGSLPHIAIVVKKHSADGKRPMIVHNIGRGPELEDMLFNYPITGHYRY